MELDSSDDEDSSSKLPCASSASKVPVPPLQWIGYELVPVNVAKCEVLLCMLQQARSADGDAEAQLIDNCMQVWYSSTWSPRTLAAFCSALEQLLASRREHLQPEVVEVLLHWRTAGTTPPPLQRARTFFAHDAQWHEWAPNFVQWVDRMAVCSYGLTRDLLPAAAADWVASLTMFELPGKWQCAPRESVFNVIPMEELLSHRMRTSDVLVAIRDYLRDGVRRVRELLLTGSVVARVELGRVELDSQAARAIQQLQPATMSWSNIVDYMDPGTFHRLLRQVSHRPSPSACSVAGSSCSPPVAAAAVRHSFHTMNWPRAIKGAYFIDYVLDSDRRAVLERSVERWRSLAQISAPQLSQLIHLPPIDNRWNLCSWPLAERFYKDWLSAFVAAERSGVANLAQHVRVLHPPYFAIFARNAVTLGLEITYPPE